MAEVNRVQGPGGSPEQKKDKATADAEKFRELMRVQKVNETDPEEQKKRKQPSEAEDEQNALATPLPTPPPTSFPDEENAPLSVKKPGSLKPLGAPPSASPPSAPSTYSPHPSDETLSDDDAFMQTLPPASQKPSPSQGNIFQEFDSSPQYPPEVDEEESSPQPPPSAQPTASSQSSPSNNSSSTQQPRKTESGQKSQPSSHTRQKAKPVVDGSKTVPPPRAKTPKSAPAKRPPEQHTQPSTGKPRNQKKDTTDRTSEEAATSGSYSPSPLSADHSFGDDKNREKKEKNNAAIEGLQSPQAAPPMPDVTPLSGPLPAYTNLHPQVLQIFERMVGVISLLKTPDETVTTVTLNSPQFASSVFYGAQIIIKEYTSAPLAYNVQLLGSPQAVALFQGNVDVLMASFAEGNYPFRINRLDTGILREDKPLFKRKEAISGEEKGNDTQ